MKGERLKKSKFFNATTVGEHICSIYKNKHEQDKIISSFVQQGIESGKKCIIGCNDQRKAEIIKVLKEEIDVSYFTKKEQLTFYDLKELYLTDGEFKPDHVISQLKTLEKHAKEQGFRGIQGTAEITESLSQKLEVDKLFEYEAKLNYFIENEDSFLLCQYNENNFSPKFLLDVIHSHPKILLYGSLYENPYYTPPEQFLVRREGNIPSGLYKSIIQDIRQRSQLVKNENVARNRMNQLSSLLSILQEINRITARETELATMFQKSAEVLVKLEDYMDVSIFLALLKSFFLTDPEGGIVGLVYKF